MSATQLLAAPMLLTGLLVGAPAIEKAGPGFLGVQIRLSQNGGGLEIVLLVEGAAAAKAKLQVGDVIAQLDGDNVGTAQDFVKAIGKRKAGEKVKLHIFRAGNEEDVSVVLGEVPKDLPKPDPNK